MLTNKAKSEKTDVYSRNFFVGCRLGRLPWDPDQRTFPEKVPWNLKNFRQNKVVYFDVKFLRIFKVLFTKSTLKQGLERQFQYITIIKKHGVAVLFLWALSVGASAPNPDQRTFREKSFGISKASLK